MITAAQGILLHLGKRLEGNAVRLAERVGGAIVTGAQTGPRAQELTNKPIPLLLQDDCSATQTAAGRLFSAEQTWALQQEGRVAAYTSPTSYIPSPQGTDEARAESDRALAEAIEAGNAFRSHVLEAHSEAQVWTFVALDHRWLSRQGELLVRRLGDTDGPVGLMVWHRDDPFARPAAIEGMLQVIDTYGAQIGVLRTDLAGIGFRAHGASLVSIGIGTGTRHFSTAERGGFANVQDPSPRLLVPMLLSFWKGSRVAQLPTDRALVCACPTCESRHLGRFLDPALKLEAAEHSVECWATLAEQLETVDPARREMWWQAKVRNALYELEALEERLYLPQAPCPQLEAWQEVMGVRTG